jgi:hypothetical protein
MTQRKVNMAMVKNTPIRLVALDEEPPDDDPTQIQEPLPEVDTAPTPVAAASPAQDAAAGPAQDAAPLTSTPEHEAITRRVPAVAAPVAQAPEWPKPTRTWRRFLPVIIALVPVIALSMAWLLSRPAQAPESSAVAPAPNRDQVAPSLPLPSARPLAPTLTLPTAAAQGAKAPDVIRLQITAEPVQAEVGLDGNVLAGHRLNLEVPKDRSIHVISATAPGYIPFNQQVSFSNDVVLNISLRRAHGSAGRPASRQRPSAEAKASVVGRTNPPAPQVESKPQSTGKRPTSPRLEPGMDLDVPAPRHGAKSLDERNPYRP